MKGPTTITNPIGFYRLYIFLPVLAIILGGIIYILFRPSEHVFFNWIRAAGLGKWFNHARSFSLASMTLPDWFLFSLPDGLFAFAYAMLITGIWAGSKSWIRYCWMASIPGLILGYEFLQYAGVVKGIFCMSDFAMETVGLFTGIIIVMKVTKSRHHGNKS